MTKTCSSRGEKWYFVGKYKKTNVFFPRRMGDRFLIPYCFKPIFCSDNLFPIYLKNKRNTKLLAALLNSTITLLFNEIQGRNLTGALNVIDVDVWMVNKLLIPDLSLMPKKLTKLLKKKFDSLSLREVLHSLKELGASSPESVTLENVLPDRREIDKIIMGDILGLNDNEQLEVYKAVVDLVKSRIEKAKSVGNNEKINGIDIKTFSKSALEDIRKTD